MPVMREEEKSMRERADMSFEFVGCIELRQMLGIRVETERQLANFLRLVPLDCVYYHTHGSLLRHRYRAGMYSNDFATWAAIEVRDRVLGERLAVLDPLDCETLADLRGTIIAVIEDHLRPMTVVPRVVHGEPFDFIESQIVAVPTGVKVTSLVDFRRTLSEVEDSTVYYHALEARVRLKRRQNDFSVWLKDGLGLPGLAAKVDALDPYTGGLERVRNQMLAYCDEVLTKGDDL
jgi:hypothetical protein